MSHTMSHAVTRSHDLSLYRAYLAYPAKLAFLKTTDFSESGQQEFPRVAPPKADVLPVIVEYRRKWVETQKPLDNRPPDLAKPDLVQARALVREFGPEGAIAMLD